MPKLYGVIGDPIDHSLSPVMHQKWLRENGYDDHYHAFRVTKDQLEDAVCGLRALGAGGFNVTIPHKTAIIPLLDDIDEEAEVIGAVNTVINENGRLVGTNTDAIGFMKSLEEKGFAPEAGDSVLVIGAGGAARAVCAALAKRAKIRVDLTNRTPEAAERLSARFFNSNESAVWTLEEAEKRLAQYRLIINATPVGMSGFADALPIWTERLTAHTICVDLIYRPLKTRFLEAAEQIGAPTLNGLPMLIHQGAAAFQRWLGIWPDTFNMEKYLLENYFQ